MASSHEWHQLEVCGTCGNVVAAGPATCFNCDGTDLDPVLAVPTGPTSGAGATVQWHLYGEFVAGVGLREDRVEVGAGGQATVRGALEALLERYPDLRPKVLDGHDELAETVTIVHNRVNVYHEPAHLETVVRPGDELALFRRIA